MVGIEYSEVNDMRDADFAWLIDQGPDLFDKYAGKWIAVRDGKVIGVGDTAVEADGEARKIAPDGDFILEAVDRSADVIYEHEESGGGSGAAYWQ